MRERSGNSKSSSKLMFSNVGWASAKPCHICKSSGLGSMDCSVAVSWRRGETPARSGPLSCSSCRLAAGSRAAAASWKPRHSRISSGVGASPTSDLRRFMSQRRRRLWEDVPGPAGAASSSASSPRLFLRALARPGSASASSSWAPRRFFLRTDSNMASSRAWSGLMSKAAAPEPLEFTSLVNFSWTASSSNVRSHVAATARKHLSVVRSSRCTGVCECKYASHSERCFSPFCSNSPRCVLTPVNS
mmetsp:Transcript_109974/g.307466  ORF Transcript_109974/g.307466 Transcript_109974/m.307466 type:complete len:246 (+) Transcript_109974:199-936(+)